MKNDLISKKMIIVIICGLILAFLMAFFLAFYLSTHSDEEGSAGIRNEENIFRDPQVTKEELEQQDAEKPEATEDDLSTLDIKMEQCLSTGDYSELESYLSGLENTYRDSADSSVTLQMERVHGARQDLAMISGISEENGKELLKAFSCPDTLASALLYLPLSTKYEAFMNLSAIAVPSMEEKSGQVRMKEKPFSEEESKSLLADLSERWNRDFVDIARYSAMVASREVEIIVLQDGETAFWRPYTIRPADGDMDGFVSIQQAQTVAENLEVLNGLSQLDDVISYSDGTEERYQQWLEEEEPPDREPNTADDPSLYETASETEESVA